MTRRCRNRFAKGADLFEPRGSAQAIQSSRIGSSEIFKGFNDAFESQKNESSLNSWERADQAGYSILFLTCPTC